MSPRRVAGATGLLAPLLLLGGCGVLSAVTAGAVGASTGAATANPVVGYAAAVGTNAALDELQKYVARTRGRATQDAILQTVATMQPGQQRAWKIVHAIPEFDDQHGEMTVVRDIPTPLAECKEVLFTVDHGRAPALRQAGFVTTACDDTRGWQWAAAEPATERWGYFQHISH